MLLLYFTIILGNSLTCPDIKLPTFPNVEVSRNHSSVQHLEEILALSHTSSGRCHTWKCSTTHLPHDTCQYCFPALLIGGLSKCGTSALFAKIATHPSVATYWDKEVNIFNYRNAIPPYFQNFTTLETWLGPPKSNSSSYYYLDGSAGTSRDLQSIALLKHYSPTTKVIFMVRDAKARFISWLAMVANDHNANVHEYSATRGRALLKSLRKAIGSVTIEQMSSPSFVHDIAFYGPMMAYFLVGPMLLPWVQLMGDNVMVIDHAELLESPHTVLSRVETWLGLEHHNYSMQVLKAKTNVYGSWGWFTHILNSTAAPVKRHHHISFGEGLDEYLDDLIEKSDFIFQKLVGWIPRKEEVPRRRYLKR